MSYFNQPLKDFTDDNIVHRFNFRFIIVHFNILQAFGPAMGDLVLEFEKKFLKFLTFWASPEEFRLSEE